MLATSFEILTMSSKKLAASFEMLETSSKMYAAYYEMQAVMRLSQKLCQCNSHLSA